MLGSSPGTKELGSQTALSTRLSRRQLTDKAPSGHAGPTCQLDTSSCHIQKGLSFLPQGALLSDGSHGVLAGASGGVLMFSQII